MACAAPAIEDYGLIGDCQTAALVARTGAIDWLCWPRFDSPSCFAALVGRPEHGRWQIAPLDAADCHSRGYRDKTMVLETRFETAEGSVALIDFMAMDQEHSSLIRIIEGRSGRVRLRSELNARFDYGATTPWLNLDGDRRSVTIIGGPNQIALYAPVELRVENAVVEAEFTVAADERAAFVLRYGLSHLAAPANLDAEAALHATERFWRDWSKQCSFQGEWHDAVMRSLLTLKALSFRQTGGIVAAPTTSLPERAGGARNWDYRYCWLRDASLTLIALMGAGFHGEAQAWHQWLHRAVAGSPSDMQIMYGVAGERRLPEYELPWLPGYQGAAPVRAGNAASAQLQLDIWGELMNALHLARQGGIDPMPWGWELQLRAMEYLETIWAEPDNGIWEMRGGRRQFTHSKVMVWVAFDRSIDDAETYGLEAPLARWRAIRRHVHAMVCEQGFNPARGAFTQSFGSLELDATQLLMPLLGFLPVADPRVAATVAAIERELLDGGLVRRYRSESGTDGLPGGEGVFLACSLWLADVYQMQGRFQPARAMVERVLALRNDLGLLAEEYDVTAQRLVGNFPQAFSHMALVRAIYKLQG